MSKGSLRYRSTADMPDGMRKLVQAQVPVQTTASVSAIENEIVLIWPARALHPNSRVHWAKKSTAVRDARQNAKIRALECGWQNRRLPDGRLHVWIDAYPPDRRRRDADGLLTSLKAALDGIADVLGVDDRRFVPHPFVKDEVRKPLGQVRIRITGGPADG